MEKKKWIKHIPLFIIELAVLVAAVGVLYITLHATDSKNGAEKDNLKEENIAVNEEVKEKAAEIEHTEGEKNQYTGIFNLAFFGVDARDGSLGKGNRSDTIMICSINMDTHEIRLVSIYRDTFLNLGNDTYKKCNTAYAQGGPEQAIGMINMNTDLYVTDYITVGFEGLKAAIDALGGIEMEITETEITHLNNYQSTMAEEMDIEYTPVTESGVQVLNGLQATAYCRIRYGGGDDFRRAQRQRDVLVAMIEKSKKASLKTLTNAMNAVLPSVRTSLDVGDILPVLSMVGDYKVTQSDGFPYSDMRNGGIIGAEGSCVVPTSLEDNVKKLHEMLYGEKDYEPSKAVKEYSKIIEEKTKDYLMY
ncbi:LCP family protein [Parablautia muri]|uniref:LytR family transcriptional regulator n=1 Tax=Parablautia muri TaxID=2320879 RepID=A0A9X5BCU3_9FIRM|nr:LCP family protein [Parablautia muri]NBJ91654.1 LytR family transcriptional regulator [Parablautia muri]